MVSDVRGRECAELSAYISVKKKKKKNHYSRGMFREVLTTYQLIMPTRHREYSILQKLRKSHVKAKLNFT